MVMLDCNYRLDEINAVDDNRNLEKIRFNAQENIRLLMNIYCTCYLCYQFFFKFCIICFSLIVLSYVYHLSFYLYVLWIEHDHTCQNSPSCSNITDCISIICGNV